MEKKDLILFFDEIRKSLIIITAIVFFFAIISFAFSDQIRSLLLQPGERAYSGIEGNGANLKLIFLTPSEALLANLRLAFITSAVIALPIILYQLTRLVMAAYGKARKHALLLTLIMYFLFASGVVFAYFVVLPFAMNFFIGFSAADLMPSFSIARYISFTTSFILSFGLVFQLPVVFWFLGSIGLIDAPFLRRNRKFALLIIVIFAAILTPPDIFSQVLMAIPLLLLYETGIFMVYLARRKSKNTDLVEPRVG